MAIKAVLMGGDGSTITYDNLVPDNLKAIIIHNQKIKWIMATGRSLELPQKNPIFNYLSLVILCQILSLNFMCKRLVR